MTTDDAGTDVGVLRQRVFDDPDDCFTRLPRQVVDRHLTDTLRLRFEPRVFEHWVTDPFHPSCSRWSSATTRWCSTVATTCRGRRRHTRRERCTAKATTATPTAAMGRRSVRRGVTVHSIQCFLGGIAYFLVRLVPPHGVRLAAELDSVLNGLHRGRVLCQATFELSPQVRRRRGLRNDLEALVFDVRVVLRPETVRKVLGDFGTRLRIAGSVLGDV
mmetsp:Transcript_3043/g.6857  ORF Transcript_3043/g.6857 Transcript_3043/m.6857 type:complete len:217 (-) Transcript_3043:560-1210(-)